MTRSVRGDRRRRRAENTHAVRAAHCLRVAGRVEADERRAAVTDEGVLVDGKVHHTDQRL